MNYLRSQIQSFMQSRHAWLWVFAAIILFNLSHKLADHFLGDRDGIVSGHLRYLVFDFNIVLSICFIVCVYLKSLRCNDIKIGLPAWIMTIVAAVSARLYLSQLGHNFDLESYEIVSDIILRGESVYGQTERYNYGPVWAYMLAGIRYLSEWAGYSQKTFHLLIVLVLSIAELLFYRLLFQKYRNNLMILLLLFNPVSLVIIGHHSQFDILALALAFAATQQIEKKQMVYAVLLLGLSYCTKHIMVFYPLLLLFDKSLNLRNRLILLTLPAVIFAVSFLPFYADMADIQKNVLGYQFNNNQTFLKQFFDLLIPGFIIKMGIFKILPVFQGYKFLWLAIFPLVGYLTAKYKAEERFFIYLLCIVASSLAISEQYFLIPLAAVAFYRKHFLAWLYLAASSYFILFVSFNNTSKYFSLRSMGIAADFEWYQLGFAQVQLCLAGLLTQVLYQAWKRTRKPL
jgi:hypothetical protein